MKTKKLGNILTCACCGALITGLCAAHLLLPDGLYSVSERRKLANMPQLSVDNVLSGEWADDTEDYLLDRFPLRDTFRTLKAYLSFGLFCRADNNGVYIVGDGVYRTEYPLKENQVEYGIGKINGWIEQYFAGCANVVYSVVPDKNVFAAEQNGYPHMDYDRMLAMLNGGIKGAEYADIFSVLSEDDYYRTDTHWSQDMIFAVRDKLAAALGVEYTVPESEWTAHTLSPFYGVYCGQSALPVKPDTLIYMTSDATDKSVVTGLEFDEVRGVYDEAHFNNVDGYDVFLSGAQSLLTVDCEGGNGRTLVLFRDSYGSSIAPLFCGTYSRIILVDMRYISSVLLPEYLDFDPAATDVLFLYSTSVLNNAMLLK